MSMDHKLLFEQPSNSARLRLFFFPYGGGGASIGAPYRKLLSKKIDFISIQFPGRENRIKEFPFVRMTPVIEELLLAVSPYLDVPFVLWGHCSGAIIAFELARKLQEQFKLGSEALIVSACSAPQLIHSDPSLYLHRLPDKQFLLKIQEIMKGASVSDSSNEQIIQILTSTIKADFAVYETYIYQPYKLLSCPIIAFGGSKDKRVSEKELKAWQDQTTGRFIFKTINNGNHFFINSQISEVVEYINSFILSHQQDNNNNHIEDFSSQR